MTRNSRIILLLCIASVAGFIALQTVWLYNYNQVNKDRFEKDANLAFEDAVKKEFMLRCDTLESLMYKFLTDTSEVRISSKWSPNLRVHVYRIQNRKDTADDYDFSHKHLNLPIQRSLDSVYLAVARRAASAYRSESLEQHIIFYRTQNIGKYIGEKAEHEFSFDTARLRPLYKQFLAERNIHEPFSFYYADKDSLLNTNNFPDSLKKNYAVITKAFTTFKNEKGKNYVRALLDSGSAYLLTRLRWMLMAALLLLFVIAYSLYYLFRSLNREKKLSAIKNDFVNNVTHELKTPVATVAGAIDAMTDFDALQDPEKTARYLAISKQELQRLSGMIDQILYSSVYDNPGFTLHRETVDMNDLFRQLMEQVKLNTKKEMLFTYNATGPAVLEGDRLHLFNCFNNLLDNAIKYSGDPVQISIILEKNGKEMIISIEDNGTGIPEGYQPFIFDKFFRVPQQDARMIKGHGLGLSYVKTIIEKHGGRCSVYSKPNKGTRFTVTLPL